MDSRYLFKFDELTEKEVENYEQCKDLAVENIRLFHEALKNGGFDSLPAMFAFHEATLLHSFNVLNLHCPSLQAVDFLIKMNNHTTTEIMLIEEEVKSV